MQGVAGILAALRHRDRTGEGQRITADMMSSSLYLMAQEASYVLNLEPEPRRSAAGIAHVNQSAPYGIYRTRDGAVAVSSFSGVPVVERLAAAFGIGPALAPYLTEQKLRHERDAVARLLGAEIARLTSVEAVERLSPSGAWVVPVRSLSEALADEAVVASGIVRTVETPYGGRYRVVVEPLRMEATPLVAARPAPAHGEHSGEVLWELGFSKEEARALVERGVVVAADLDAERTVAARPAS
jgi:crotonobetainyl-CoA:carnitine CoA-transferase CaiB-like acyl-CoA transferase